MNPSFCAVHNRVLRRNDNLTQRAIERFLKSHYQVLNFFFCTARTLPARHSTLHRGRYVANTVVLSVFFSFLSLHTTYIALGARHYSRGDKEKGDNGRKRRKRPFRSVEPNCGRCHDKYRFSRPCSSCVTAVSR